MFYAVRTLFLTAIDLTGILARLLPNFLAGFPHRLASLLTFRPRWFALSFALHLFALLERP